MISVVCDYCGGVVEDDDESATIAVCGVLPSDDGRQLLHDGWLGHYHTARVGEAPSCYDRVRDAMRLAESLGRAITATPVASPQAIARLRAGHTRPTDVDGLPVDELPVSARTLSTLKRHAVLTVLDVRNGLTTGSLAQLPRIGAKALDELLQALATLDATHQGDRR